ncbi:hypothetical protein MMS31_25580, partial [Escherichia coli]|nr:hypothetical protein [Escherichia coli]
SSASSLSSGEYLPGSLQGKISSDGCLKKEQMVVSAIASTPQWDRNRPQIDTEIELRMLFKKCNYLKKPRKRQGNHRMGKNTCELWISRVIQSN